MNTGGWKKGQFRQTLIEAIIVASQRGQVNLTQTQVAQFLKADMLMDERGASFLLVHEITDCGCENHTKAKPRCYTTYTLDDFSEDLDMRMRTRHTEDDIAGDFEYWQLWRVDRKTDLCEYLVVITDESMSDSECMAALTSKEHDRVNDALQPLVSKHNAHRAIIYALDPPPFKGYKAVMEWIKKVKEEL